MVTTCTCTWVKVSGLNVVRRRSEPLNLGSITLERVDDVVRILGLVGGGTPQPLGKAVAAHLVTCVRRPKDDGKRKSRRPGSFCVLVLGLL